MIQVGVFTGYFPYALEETATRIRKHGFNTVQLDAVFKDMELGAEAITPAKCKTIRETFRAHDLPVSCVSAYTNLVHPDPDERQRRLALTKALIRHSRELGSPYVISETGTFNPESDWVAHPKNKTEEGYAICRDIIAGLVEEARAHGAIFCLETYVNNVIGSIEETLRLFAEIDSPNLALLMDPTNYFESHNIDRMDQTLNRIFDALDDKIMIAHAKDVMRAGADKSEKHADIDADESHTFRGVGEIELPAPGLGALNYDLYLKRLAAKHPNIPIIIEHIDEPDVTRAKSFVSGKLQALGC